MPLDYNETLLTETDATTVPMPEHTPSPAPLAAVPPVGRPDAQRAARGQRLGLIAGLLAGWLVVAVYLVYDDQARRSDYLSAQQTALERSAARLHGMALRHGSLAALQGRWADRVLKEAESASPAAPPVGHGDDYDEVLIYAPGAGQPVGSVLMWQTPAPNAARTLSVASSLVGLQFPDSNGDRPPDSSFLGADGTLYAHAPYVAPDVLRRHVGTPTVPAAIRQLYLWVSGTHQPVNDGRVRWSEPYPDPAGNGWAVSAYRPVYRDDLLFGFTTVNLNLSNLQQALNAQSTLDGDAYLMTPAGHLIAANHLTGPNATQLGKAVGALPPALAARGVPTRALTPAGDAHIGVLDDAPTGWRLAYYLPASAMTAHLMPSRRAAAMLLAALTLGGLLAGWLADRRLIRPALRARLRAEEEQRRTAERERQLRAMLDGAIEGVVTLDDQGRIEYWNPAATTLFGWQAKEVLGRPIHEVMIPPEQREAANRKLQAVLESGQGERIGTVTELEGIRKDGSPISVALALSAYQVDGRWQVVGFVQDISARKQQQASLERALKEAEARRAQLHEMSDALPVAVFQASSKSPEQGRFHFMSRQVVDILGVDADVLLRDTSALWRNVPEPHAEQLRTTLLEARAVGRTLSQEFPVSFGGVERWVRLGAKARRLADGSVLWNGYCLDLTDIKRAEHEVRLSEAYFRAVFDSAGVAIVGLDKQGRITSANDRFTDFLGYPRGSLNGRPLYELTHAADAAQTRAHLLQQRAGELDSFRLEVRFTHRDGRECWGDLQSTALRDEHGELQASIVCIVDVTDLKRAEQAGRDQLYLQRQLLDAIPSPLFFKDDEGRFIGCNRAFETAFGISRDTLLGRTVLEVEGIDPEARQSYHNEDMRLIRDGGQLSYTEKMTLADRHSHDLHYALASYDLADGNHGGMIGVITDITPQKEAERQARIALEKFRVLFDMFPVGISIHGEDGGTVEVNRRSQEIFGIGNEALYRRGIDVEAWKIQQPDGNLFPADQLPANRAMREQRLIENVEMGIPKPDGSIVWLSVSAAPLPLEGYSVAAVYQDITLKRESERQLIDAKAKAEEATRLKSSFLANMSHEIRTPMNAILGLAHLALATELNAKQRDYLSKIHNAGLSLLGLINDILDFSKIEAGKLSHRLPAGRRAGQCVDPDRPEGLRERPGVAVPRGARRAAGPGGRPVAPRPGAGEPGQQRGQVHRDRRDRSPRGTAGRNQRAGEAAVQRARHRHRHDR